jgi:hypothetical protein
MTYTIGFSPRPKGKISKATLPDAKRAFKEVLGLRASDETIRFIRAPWGAEIGVEELRMYAEQEMKDVQIPYRTRCPPMQSELPFSAVNAQTKTVPRIAIARLKPTTTHT